MKVDCARELYKILFILQILATSRRNIYSQVEYLRWLQLRIFHLVIREISTSLRSQVWNYHSNFNCHALNEPNFNSEPLIYASFFTSESVGDWLWLWSWMVLACSAVIVVVGHTTDLGTVDKGAVIVVGINLLNRFVGRQPFTWIFFRSNRNQTIITTSIHSSTGIYDSSLENNFGLSYTESVLFLQISWLLLIFGPVAEYIILSRFLTGLIGGGAHTCTALYCAEIANDNIRGKLSTTYSLLRNSGVLLGYVVGIYVNYIQASMIYIGISILFAMSFIRVPETPQYLLRIGANDVSVLCKT